MANSPDPAAMFRDMLGQWEKVANSFGGDTLKSEEFARSMQGAGAAGMQMQAGMHQMMERALGAANMPTRGDVEAIGARIAALEATLARIERKLDGAPEPQARPRPARTRKPPAAKD